MSLKILTQKNHLQKKEASRYFVRGVGADMVVSEAFIDIMSQGKTTLAKPDILAVMQLFKEEIGKLLADGKYVKTPIGSFYLSARGTLENETDAFLPKDGNNNHKIRVHFRPERRFEQDITSSVKVVRSESVDRSSARILSAVSVKNGAGMKAKPGDTIRIEGLRLKFNPRESALGLFFVKADGEDSRARTYAIVQPGVIVAEVPRSLAAGAYTLAVRTLPYGTEVREGCAERPFIIEEAATP